MDNALGSHPSTHWLCAPGRSGPSPGLLGGLLAHQKHSQSAMLPMTVLKVEVREKLKESLPRDGSLSTSHCFPGPQQYQVNPRVQIFWLLLSIHV